MENGKWKMESQKSKIWAKSILISENKLVDQ